MTLHPNIFEYLKPTDKQMEAMANVRSAYALLADHVQLHVPDGADRTHALRLLRTSAMWANVAITREADGTPRA